MIKPYNGPAGGWRSIKSVATVLQREGLLIEGPLALSAQNKPEGFKCVSCAWAKPADHHPAEFCENGAKATAWEITSVRCEPAFFCLPHLHRKFARLARRLSTGHGRARSDIQLSSQIVRQITAFDATRSSFVSRSALGQLAESPQLQSHSSSAALKSQ